MSTDKNASHAVQDAPYRPEEARVGTALNSKWRIDGLLGVGGMAAVYAATHRNGARAALKVLHAELSTDKNVRERFLREGRIANKVDHPARVPVIDDDVSDLGEPFIVMDLLEGETLNQMRLAAGGRLGLEFTLKVFDTVLDLLAKCHEVGVVHRDIKPANIFVTKEGAVKVLDFGVARMREPDSGVEATRAGTAIGTPSYMAPEQALGLGAQVDGRSDIWSVGACIHVALTGMRLNSARTEAESFVMAATQAAPSIANAGPDLPPAIVAFVDKSLMFERDKRYQDASAMRAELVGLLAAMRAGQLVVAPKKKGGVRLRQNDQIDIDEDLPTEERRTVHARIASVWAQINICLTDVRQYGWTHPTSVRGFQASFQLLVEALAAAPLSTWWEVTAGAFTFSDEPVWSPERPPFDRVPFQLFADGVRRIQIKEGILEEEFRDLIAILMRDAGNLDAEDDSVTALWDRRFEHVAYLAIDSFAESDGDDAATFAQRTADLATQFSALAKLDRDFDDAGLEGQAMQLNLLAQLKESGESAAALAVDPLTKATLGAQLALPEENWRGRFVDVFADAWVEARRHGDLSHLEAALRSWTKDQLELHSLAAIFELFESIVAALRERLPAEAADAERAVAAVMLPQNTIATILQELAKEGRGQATASKEVEPTVLTGISRALDLLGDRSMLELACGCYDAFRSEALRAVLLAYVKRWAVGNESALGAVLETTGPEFGVTLVRLLVELGSQAAQAALDLAPRSPHLEVRIEALWAMPPERKEHVRAEVRKMLDDASPSVRQEALRLVAARKLLAAGAALVLQIQLPKFHELAIEERRTWLQCLAQLNLRRAEAVSIELLGNRPLIPSAAIEGTRTLAADLLAQTSSEEALAAAVEAAKKRWWNTTPVREAAERAAAAIRERRAAGLVETPRSVEVDGD